MKGEDLGLLIAGLLLGGTLVYFLVKKTESVIVSAPAVIAENAETWEWTDYKGNRRDITVHREVRG